jgi:pimeloyl-ACP methyl ester carboxylesterase
MLAASIDAELYKAGLAAVHDPNHQPTGDVLDQNWQAFSSAEGIAEMPRFLHYIPERNERSERLVYAIEHTTVAQRFIWGDSDPISGSLQSHQIRARYGTGVDLVTFADCSHYPHLERPDAVVAELLRPW